MNAMDFILQYFLDVIRLMLLHWATLIDTRTELEYLCFGLKTIKMRFTIRITRFEKKKFVQGAC